jgi:peptidyl-prolyl cis-trans isomerase C
MSCSIPSLPAGRAKVSVNGVPIPRETIAQEVQHHPAAKPVDAWRAAAQALVIRELLGQEARRLGIAAEPLSDAEGRRETEEEAAVRALVERGVVTPEPTDAECLRYYAQNRARFRSPETWEASHILLKASAADPEAYRAAGERASRLAEILRREPRLFSDIAKAHSDCPSASEGGRLGQLSAGDTTPEFEAALAALRPGMITPEPVATRYGFHLVRLEAHAPGRDLDFDAVRGRIASYLTACVRRRALAHYVALLASRAQVTGIEIAAARGPLVQ